MPIVRSPWTLLCPRTGQAPAPGRPTLPRSSRKLAISRIVATALRCWVSPIAQQTTMLRAATTSSTNASIASRVSPVIGSRSAKSSLLQAAAAASKPSQYVSMNSRSRTVPGAASSRSSRIRFTALNSARSPFTRTGRYWSASFVPGPASPRAVCGLRNLIRPASGSGLIATMRAPRRFAASSAVSMRGWLVPGFCPTMTMSSAWSAMSTSRTVPLPMPNVWLSAKPLDS